MNFVSETGKDLVVLDGVIPSEDLLRKMAKTTDKVVLAFSCGKDAIAAWLNLRRYFKVYPYYMYVVPDLEFIERGIRYYEDFFETHIVRVPQPQFWKWIDNNIFQPSHRTSTTWDLGVPLYDKDELRDILCDEWGLSRDTWSATGVRAADSMTRRTHFKSHGPVNHRRRMFAPVWDWTKQKLVNELNRAGVKLTVDYHLFGRSFDGIDFRFIYPIKRYFPDDYAKIIEWFPMAELEIKRYEFNQARKAAK